MTNLPLDAAPHGLLHPTAFLSPRLTLTLRLMLGLLQGLFFYGLTLLEEGDSAWLSVPSLTIALLLVAFLPPLAMAALGHMRRGTLLGWLLLAGLLICGLGWYAVWLSGPVGAMPLRADANHTVLLCMAMVPGFFMAHSMVMAGSAQGRYLASYAGYFEQAWKALIQVLFSWLFVAAAWLLLWLGASLFGLVGLWFGASLLSEGAFFIPFTTLAFAAGVHLTDVKPAVVTQMRQLLLTLLSVQLPVAAVLVIGFLFALPFAGLQALWDTKSATWILLGTVTVLVLYINAAYQDGQHPQAVAPVLRGSARALALCLLPLVAIAAYSLGLRVADYGWTKDRLSAAYGVGLALLYALGYAWAATRRHWLAPLARINRFNAYLLLALLLAYFTPLADVQRLSTQNQVARLQRGEVKAADFDYRHLRFDTGRYGIEALQALRNYTGPEAETVREQAAQALQHNERHATAATPPAKSPDAVRADIRVWPSGAPLPADFTAPQWASDGMLPRCFHRQDSVCDAYRVPARMSKQPAWLLVGQEANDSAVLVVQQAQGEWLPLSRLPSGLAGCQALRQQLQAGNWKLIPTQQQDLEIAGQRLITDTPPRRERRIACPPESTSP